MSRTWLITGASSGFGRSLSERAASSGDDVIAIASRDDRLKELTAKYPDHISPVALDLTNSRAGQTIYAVIRDAGGLDVLVNNAGHGTAGSIGQRDDASVRAQFDVNVSAAVTVTRAALSALRFSQGRIVHVLALAPEELARELAPGVHVTTIHPSPFGGTDKNRPSTLGTNISGDPALHPEAWEDSDAVVDAVLAVVNAAQPPRWLAVGESAVF